MDQVLLLLPNFELLPFVSVFGDVPTYLLKWVGMYMGEKLMSDQWQDLRELMDQFPNVFSTKSLYTFLQLIPLDQCLGLAANTEHLKRHRIPSGCQNVI